MAKTLRLTLVNPDPSAGRWDAIAAAVVDWADAEGAALRDAIVMLPFAQLLPLARSAFARRGGWMPRIETTRTLAAGLGPVVSAEPTQISFDATIDALNAAALLRSQPWGAAWARRDARGFDQAARALMDTAHAMVRAASALPAAERSGHWHRAREAMSPTSGPGATESLLARVALEWAALAPARATDRLFDLANVSAWVAVRAGGDDPLTTRLMADSTAPGLLIDTDATAEDPFGALGLAHPPSFAVCDGFEDEAQSAAAQVLEHLKRGVVPVALIAQDRVLVRRVRALLEREPLRLLDETGWKLSTTRAAAQVMSMLRAARADATTDALLDWLKSGSACTGADAVALSSLEAACRRRSLTSVAALAQAVLSQADFAPEAGRLWASASAVLAMLSAGRRRPLAQWLLDLARALSAAGEWPALQADDAGRQVISALRLGHGEWLANPAWVSGASQASMDHDEFATWTDTVLEQATFLPSQGHDEPAHVVITPLAHAMLRPFAAVVFPGADDRRLGAAQASTTLLNDRQALTLQVPTSAQRRETELLGFAQLLATPHVTFMRRRVDGAEPVADSPLIERLSLALAAQGRTLERWSDPREPVELPRTPVHMTAPVAPGLLPKRLSASACEALRACPYRFFALHMLHLRERDELERDIGKRDYGTWLHAVLFEFHSSRTDPAPGAVDLERLMSLAADQQARHGIGDADFLPFAASFAHLAPRYVEWLQERDRDGARWLRGEDDIGTRHDALGDIELRGIVDRVDEVQRGAAIQVIDYKTGGAAALKEKVKQPFEDTQLAFYAALVGSTTARPLHAMYLALDGGKHLEEIRHKDVETSAAALVEGLAHDLQRLRDGAGLPALGEGKTCDHCEARGVCRRDHWSDGAPLEPSP